MKRLGFVVGLLLLSVACGDDDKAQKDAASLVALTITPDTASAPRDSAVRFVATGRYDDDTVLDLTENVTWVASPAVVASISADGVATTISPGLAAITATFGSITGNAKLTVTTVTLSSIAVTPSPASVGVGATIALAATGTYSDATTAVLTDAVKWSSSNTDRATVSNASGTRGAVTGVASGAAQIAATLNGISGAGDVSVDVPPAVNATVPVNAATNVDTLSTLAVTFNRAMLASTITTQETSGACSGALQVSRDDFATCIGLGTPVLSNSNMTATVTAVPAMAYGTSYKIRVTSAARSNENVILPAPYTQAAGFTTINAPACASGLVISQVYSSGGASVDYIELFNPTSASISLSDYRVQFAQATGTEWDVAMYSSTVGPGKRFSMTTGALGNFDATVPTGKFNLAATGGKVALTNTSATLTGEFPASDALVDVVGWGTATYFEGSGAAAATSDSAKAVVRRNQGCNDGGSNVTDFTVASAGAHNTSSPAVTCACTANERDIANEIDYCIQQTQTDISVPVGIATPVIRTQVVEFPQTGSGATQASTIIGQLGYGPVSSNPENEAGWVWFATTFNNSPTTTADSYESSFTAPITAGTYAVGARFSLDGINWTYCDTDGSGSAPGASFDPAALGRMTALPAPN